MTIREKVEQESPDGRVLYIEDLRKCLGIDISDCDTRASGEASGLVDPPKPLVEVLLTGHDLRGDFPKLREEGINFDTHLDYFGCIDTYVVVKDTCREQFGESLSRLMYYYGFASGRIVRPRNLPTSKAKFVCFGLHNAGNDAVATLKVSIAQALDSEIRTSFCGKSDLTSEFLSKPLQSMKENMVLLAYDSESVESNRYDRQRRPLGPATTEHGFAWLSLADVADVAPGEDGINWHPYIQARHWLNWEFRNFANFKYVIGNPLGFWEKYGKTQFYFDAEGPAPFHQMFGEISHKNITKRSSGAPWNAIAEGTSAIEEVTTLLQETTLDANSPNLESNCPGTRDVSEDGKKNYHGSKQNWRNQKYNKSGKKPDFQKISWRREENTGGEKGKDPKKSGNVGVDEGFVPKI